MFFHLIRFYVLKLNFAFFFIKKIYLLDNLKFLCFLSLESEIQNSINAVIVYYFGQLGKKPIIFSSDFYNKLASINGYLKYR